MTEMPERPAIATPLDDARDFAACFIAARPTVIDVIAAWAAHTHLLDKFYTTPRLLFFADDEQCGKTEAESMALRLSANPWTVNRETTRDAMRSRFDVPAVSMKPTIGIQEVSDIFGQSGRSGTSHPANTYLRTGYKLGEKLSVSRSGVPVDIDVYHASVMAGLRNAVPKDIRSRCICVRMAPGEPEMYYEGREHDPMAADYRSSLASYFRAYGDRAQKFRVPRDLHPKLTGRRREIWEPVFAVADIAGGTWPRRILAAFRDLAADQGDLSATLTSQQKIIRDMAQAAETIGGARVAGADLIAEMRRFPEPMYATLTDRSLAMFMARAMAPVEPAQFRTDDGRVVRGYLAGDIDRIAGDRLPRETDDEPAGASMADERTIFDVTTGDDVVTGDELLTSGVATVTTGATSAA